MIDHERRYPGLRSSCLEKCLQYVWQCTPFSFDLDTYLSDWRSDTALGQGVRALRQT